MKRPALILALLATLAILSLPDRAPAADFKTQFVSNDGAYGGPCPMGAQGSRRREELNVKEERNKSDCQPGEDWATCLKRQRGFNR